MKALRQIIYDFRHQPVIGWVTILGTALSLFLITVIVMMDSVASEAIAPETNRKEMMYGKYIEYTHGNGRSSSAIGYRYSKELYDSLPGIKLLSTCVDSWGDEVSDLSVPGKAPVIANQPRFVDDVFFKVFDYDFLAGRPISREDFEGGRKVAVITEHIARDLYDSPENAVGKTVFVKKVPYEVIGVVTNLSSLLENSFGDIFTPYTIPELNEEEQPTGRFINYMLPDGTLTPEQIKKEVESRYATINSRNKETNGWELIYHGQPFTAGEIDYVAGSNGDVQSSSEVKLVVFAVLLIVPAINLSTMTRSRLRRRISEIGIRRAFGCTRARVIGDIIFENFVLTLVGGIIGAVASVIFCYIFTDMVMGSTSFDMRSAETMILTPGMLINVTTILYILGFCFALNLLSAGIPAWLAAKVNPVEAISENK